MSSNHERIEELGELLSAIDKSWPKVVSEIQSRMSHLVELLISADNEQTRGKIKAFQEIINLPADLKNERAGLVSALSERSDADF